MRLWFVEGQTCEEDGDSNVWDETFAALIWAETEQECRDSFVVDVRLTEVAIPLEAPAAWTVLAATANACPSKPEPDTRTPEERRAYHRSLISGGVVATMVAARALTEEQALRHFDLRQGGEAQRGTDREDVFYFEGVDEALGSYE